VKNIHVLPTDEPSRLYKQTGVLLLDTISDISKDGIYRNQHIYITSDEEIKERDWTLMFDSFGHLFLCHKPQQYLGIEKGHHLNKGLRKIILTTDQELIKDGVKSIDDEFLEWFVKNPSCEEVEVLYDYFQVDQNNPVFRGSTALVKQHKIIIPKEEPKQETIQGKYVIIDIRNMDFMKNEKDEINYYDTEEQARLVCGMYEFENAWVMKLIYNHIEP